MIKSEIKIEFDRKSNLLAIFRVRDPQNRNQHQQKHRDSLVQIKISWFLHHFVIFDICLLYLLLKTLI